MRRNAARAGLERRGHTTTLGELLPLNREFMLWAVDRDAFGLLQMTSSGNTGQRARSNKGSSLERLIFVRVGIA